MKQQCYICSATNNLTKDHIPPKSFFKPPRPKNLITALCCRRCNEGFSKDDEAFRLWASQSAFTSSQGQWIHKHKVLGSTLKRSPKLRENIKKYIGSKIIDTDQGSIQLSTFRIPVDRANKFIIRITKGILSLYYPKYAYFNANFEARFFPEIPGANDMFSMLIETLRYDSREKDVFRFWHGFAKDNPDKGVFAFMFYDSVRFAVFVKHK